MAIFRERALPVACLARVREGTVVRLGSVSLSPPWENGKPNSSPVGSSFQACIYLMAGKAQYL